jgi:hypothetical protein
MRVRQFAIELNGGEGGIRTPGTLSGTPVFKTGAINHSATSPDTARPIIVRVEGSLRRNWLTHLVRAYNSKNRGFAAAIAMPCL